MAESDLIPPKMVMILELLPSCGMSFYRAARRVGYSHSYAYKIASRFAHDKALQEALHARMRRLLAEAGDADRIVVERILQWQHFNAHPIAGSYLIGRSPFAVKG